MYEPYERARFDSPQLDLDKFADRLSSGPMVVTERDPENEALLNAFVHVSAAAKVLKSALSSDRKQSAMSKAWKQLEKALDVIEAARAADGQ